MQEHGCAEDAEEDIDFPFDVLEGWGHEIAQREVERPVCRGGQGDSLSTHSEGEELRWVHPTRWSPGGRVGSDEEVGAGDDDFGGFAVENPGFGCDAVESADWGGFAICCHDALGVISAYVLSFRGRIEQDGRTYQH